MGELGANCTHPGSGCHQPRRSGGDKGGAPAAACQVASSRREQLPSRSPASGGAGRRNHLGVNKEVFDAETFAIYRPSAP